MEEGVQTLQTADAWQVGKLWPLCLPLSAGSALAPYSSGHGRIPSGSKSFHDGYWTTILHTMTCGLAGSGVTEKSSLRC